MIDSSNVKFKSKRFFNGFHLKDTSFTFMFLERVKIGHIQCLKRLTLLGNVHYLSAEGGIGGWARYIGIPVRGSGRVLLCRGVGGSFGLQPSDH